MAPQPRPSNHTRSQPLFPLCRCETPSWAQPTRRCHRKQAPLSGIESISDIIKPFFLCQMRIRFLGILPILSQREHETLQHSLLAGDGSRTAHCLRVLEAIHCPRPDLHGTQLSHNCFLGHLGPVLDGRHQTHVCHPGHRPSTASPGTER
jgi:hypothetical protein